MKSENYKQTMRFLLVMVILIILLFALCIMNINTGSVHISTKEILKILFAGPNNTEIDLGDIKIYYNIIWRIRLPRLLGAALLGGALSVSGLLLQTFFRNPIAGPFVLGISSGAKMIVGFVMLILFQYMKSISSLTLVTASFIGSLISMGLVLIFAKKVKNMSVLLIVGIMIGYICSAITNFCITFADELDIANLTNWSLGSFSGLSWTNLKIAAIIIIVAFVASMLISKPISAYQLNEEYARSMGINIKVLRCLLILISSILSATVTAFAGPISFVGIAVPHISKLIVNSSKPIITIPTTFLSGMVFCLMCDLIARTVFAPVELSLSTVTAIFGAPIVISLLVKKQRKI